MANNPSVIIGSLNDSELKKSIDNLVNHVDSQLNHMVNSTKNATANMQQYLKSIGSTPINFDFNGGGKNNAQILAAIEKIIVANQNLSASSKKTASETTKANNDVTTSFDQMTQAINKSTGKSNKMGILETYDMQIELLKNKLMDVRQNINIFNAAIGTGTKTNIEWGQKGLKEANLEAEKLMRQITAMESKRESLKSIMSPQGDTIKNYVKDLQKANPELALLNQQYKEGNSLLQQQTANARKYTEEVRRQAAEIRKNEDYLAGKTIRVTTPSGYDAAINIKDKLSIEEKLSEAINKQIGQHSNLEQIEAAETAKATERLAVEQKITEEKQKRKYIAPDSWNTDINGGFLKKFMSERLGVDQTKIINWDEDVSSVKTLNSALKQLKQTFDKLSNSERSSDIGKTISANIKTIESAIQRIKSQTSEKLDLKNILGFSEKSIDDITRKIKELQTYKGSIDLTKSGGRDEIKNVNEELIRLNKSLNTYMASAKKVYGVNNILSSSWNYMKNRMAFYLTVGASTNFVKNLIEVRSQYEMNERALGVLINSAERGTRIFNELSQMALVSPYTLIELSSAAKQLTAYDIAAKDVVDTTRRLADMAAAVGIPIERLTYALGQIKAYGYLNSRDNRMFANAGIPMVKQLSDYYTELEGKLVTTADVYDRIKKKAVDYGDVMSVINKMTDEGGKFFDFQAKMAETLKVKLANLELAWNNMLNDIGSETQGMLTTGITSLKVLFENWKEVTNAIIGVAAALGTYKVAMFVVNNTIGASASMTRKLILAEKQHKATMLEKESLTRRLTATEKKLIRTKKEVTAADYKQILSTKNLTREQATYLIGLNQKNKALKSAIVSMGILTRREANSITLGKTMNMLWKSFGITIKSVGVAIKSFMASNWITFALLGIGELLMSLYSASEKIKDLNRDLAEHAKETFDNLKEYLSQAAIVEIEVKAKSGQLSNEEAQKVWEEQKSKIEETATASSAFVQTLSDIPDLNERIAKSFEYLKDVKHVTDIMKDLGDNAVDMSTSIWGGFFGEGLADDLKDYVNSYERYVNLRKEEANIKNNSSDKQDITKYMDDASKMAKQSYEADLEEFVKEVKVTTNSIYNTAITEGFNITEQREFFERSMTEVIAKSKMSAKEVQIFKINAEKEYYNKSRELLDAQLAARKKAGWKQGENETKARIEALEKEFNSQKSVQQAFFSWLEKYQSSKVENMLKDKSIQEIRQGEWLTAKNKEWIEAMTKKFSDDYGVAFDELKKLVLNANTWSINIPVFFDRIGTPLDDFKKDFEARTGYKFGSEEAVKNAQSQVEIIKGLQDAQAKLEEKINTARTAARKGEEEYYNNNIMSWNQRNTQLITMIHSYGALTKAEEQAAKSKNKGSKKDLVLEALKMEIDLVKKLQGDYDKLTKSGMNSSDALKSVHSSYKSTIELLNNNLSKFSLPLLDTKLIQGKDPSVQLDYFNKVRETLIRKGLQNTNRMNTVEAVIQELTISAKTYNLDKITEGLNNKLTNLNESYELAVELDADPELGSAFADMVGINMSSLPRTIEEYGKEYTRLLNNYFDEMNVNLTLPHIRLTNDDMEAFKKMKDEGKLTENAYKLIEDAVKSYREKVKKENSDTIKDWNTLIDKFGKLQDKLMKISKEAAVDQYNIVKKFGDADDKKNAINLLDSIKIADDPEEIERLSADFQKIVSKIAEKNPAALKVYIASQNEEKEKSGKAYWDDFKNSDLYSMTFEDMANVSTAAIRKIIDQLEALKGKVKEDPASMKALMKSLKDAEKELRNRNPFYATVKGLKEYIEAAKKAKAAQVDYNKAVRAREKAQQAYDNTEDATPEEREEAYTKLKQAVEAETKAEKDNIDSQNNAEKKRKNFGAALQKTGSDIQNIGQIVGEVGNIFQTLFGNPNEYDETAEIINDVAASIEGLGKAATGVGQIASGDIIGGVSNVISGVWDTVSTWLDNSDKKISAEIKDSELAVKKLETSYRSLEREIEKAYGMSTIGAKKAAKANKELQLAELKRQLALEQSRSKKKRDNNRIEELKGQIIELEHSIKDTTEDIVNDLLGISSVGDAAEDFMKNFVDALRSGENAMKGFKESINDMIATMLVKMLTTKIIAPYIESIFNDIEKSIEDRGNSLARQVETAKGKLDRGNAVDLNNNNSIIDALRALGFTEDEIHRLVWYDESGAWDKHQSGTNQRLRDAWQKAIAAAEKNYNDKSKQLEDATSYNLEDIKEVGVKWRELEPVMSEKVEEIQSMINELGLMKPYKLSALQQGIQGVTEDTAGAIEAYMNILNQHVFKQEASVTEIKDMLAQFNPNVQLGLMSQMLLQLQQSYQMQQSIKSILEGWSSNDGMSVKVELRS